MGLGGGGGASITSPLVAELFGIKSHGLLLGFHSFGYTIGAAAGPFIAGYTFDVTGSYQLAFLAAAAFGAFGIILATLLRPVKKFTL